VLIYTSVEHHVEAWACLLSNHGRNNTAESLCRELRAARYLLIPLFALGVIILATVVRSRFGKSKERDAPSGVMISGDNLKEAEV
jgi:cell division septation protein DedD